MSATSAVQGSKQSHLSRRQDPQKESCSKNAQQHCGQHLSHHGVRWIVAVGRVCVHLYLMVCVCVCARARACVCVRVYVCMCVYAYVYTRTHIHITHTHKHTHTHRYHGISITNNEALRFCRQRQCVCICTHAHTHRYHGISVTNSEALKILQAEAVCVHICTHAHTHRQRQCVCMYVHTHIHTPITAYLSRTLRPSRFCRQKQPPCLLTSHPHLQQNVHAALALYDSGCHCRVSHNDTHCSTVGPVRPGRRPA